MVEHSSEYVRQLYKSDASFALFPKPVGEEERDEEDKREQCISYACGDEEGGCCCTDNINSKSCIGPFLDSPPLPLDECDCAKDLCYADDVIQVRWVAQICERLLC